MSTTTSTLLAHGLAGERWQPGVLGRLLCLLASILLAVALPGPQSVWALGLVVALALVFAPAGLRVLLRPSTWLFMTLLVAPAALGSFDLLTPHAVPDAGVRLREAARMGLRAVAILVAFAAFAASVSAAELALLFERVGLKGLGFAVGVAANILPELREEAALTLHALRLRGGFRRRPLRDARLLLVTVVTNALRRSDDIVAAAEARAFQLDPARRPEIARRRGDLAVVGLLVAAVIALLSS